MSIYLTFDDGPDPVSTPAVLDVLRAHDVRATFFVVANLLSAQPELVARMRREGHAFGHHSLDHGYRRFFQREARLSAWIHEGAAALTAAGLHDSVGFRPPAGVVTPPLRRVLRELGEPLVLWNIRFFDAVIPWTAGRATRAGARVMPGSVVLLHDRQRAARIRGFCTSLDLFIGQVRARGLDFAVLERRRSPDSSSHFV